MRKSVGNKVGNARISTKTSSQRGMLPEYFDQLVGNQNKSLRGNTRDRANAELEQEFRVGKG